MGGLNRGDLQELAGMLLSDARRHIDRVDDWRKKEYGDAER